MNQTPNYVNTINNIIRHRVHLPRRSSCRRPRRAHVRSYRHPRSQGCSAWTGWSDWRDHPTPTPRRWWSRQRLGKPVGFCRRPWRRRRPTSKLNLITRESWIESKIYFLMCSLFAFNHQSVCFKAAIVVTLSLSLTLSLFLSRHNVCDKCADDDDDDMGENFWNFSHISFPPSPPQYSYPWLHGKLSQKQDRTQCDQIGRCSKVIAANFLIKVAQIFGNFLGYFKVYNYIIKIYFAYFLGQY